MKAADVKSGALSFSQSIHIPSLIHFRTRFLYRTRRSHQETVRPVKKDAL